MTNPRDEMCDRARLAAMARLDAERVPPADDGLEAHVAGCEQCRAEIDAMTRLHARLDALSYDTAPRDLWFGIQARIEGRRILKSSRERLAFAGLAGLALAWRTAQLVFDVPVPVLNGLVPLAAALLIGWWVAGDPLAIQSLVLEDQQERA